MGRLFKLFRLAPKLNGAAARLKAELDPAKFVNNFPEGEAGGGIQNDAVERERPPETAFLLFF